MDNVWFQQNIIILFIPTPRKVIGNSEWVGVSKAKFFKGKYETKLKFSEGLGGGGGGVQPNKITF